jgi:hypothetical protein
VRSLAESTLNDDHMLKINKVVRDAGKTGREIEALKALDEIPEIGLPAHQRF